MPFIRNYRPEEYHGFFQNWCAEQDNRGVMYFGNGKGILEYNGKNWRRFFTEKVTTVLSMGKDSKGRIYVGGENEIGYLAPDSTGLVRFYSLMNRIPEKEQNFGYVWHVYTNESGIYFVAPEKVIKITPGKTKIYKPSTSFFTAFMARGQFFIQDQTKGLFIEKSDSLVSTPGGENYCDIRAILPLGKKYLFATRNRGCFLYDDSTLPQAYNTQCNALFRESQLYKGVVLPDSSFAFATNAGGIILMNRDGSVKNVINENYGLLSNLVYYLYVDKQGGLWACLGNGLSRIEASSPFTYFGKHYGINDVVQDLLIANNELYISCLDGLFVLKKSTFGKEGFLSAHPQKFENLNTQVFTSSAFGNGILFAGSGGVYFYDGKNFKLTFHFNNEICVKTSRFYKDLYYIGGSGFVYAVKKRNNRWIAHKIYDNGIEDFYFICEQKNGKIWAGTVNHGIFKFDFTDTLKYNSGKEIYDSVKGIPKGMTEITCINNSLFAGTAKGIFKYNEKENKFIPANEFDSLLFSGKHSVYLLSSDSNNNIWSMYDKTICISRPDSGKYKLFDVPFRRLQFTDMYKILPGKDGIIWIGGTDGLIRYDEKSKKNYKTEFYTVFYRIIAIKDTVFSGTYFDSNGFVTTTQPEQIKNTFRYKGNAFIFEFAAPSFDNEESNTYSYFLEGFDEVWSDWTSENKKEYTNLPEGTYTFRVKAKNIYGTEGQEATYRFTVLAPWYRTWWAYFLFFILALIVIYLVVKFNTRRLRRANIKLESIVTQRTEELRNRNAEIMQQKEEIEAQRDEIEAQRDNLIILNEEIHQQKEEIEAQRDEIEIQRDKIVFQNKEMTDSIKYAEMIQSAIMHPPILLNSILPESFIFFKPKDIVSGDFYWFTEIDKKIYVAAVDCTGHGVPGGFMSMLGMSFLNEIAGLIKLKTKDFTAADILFELRKKVIRSLNQTSLIYNAKNISKDGSIVKDGMDIALCIIDQEHNKINFAGANNPLYIVRKFIKPESKKAESEKPVENNFQLDELKGDKMPIGAYTDNEKPFTNHVLDIEEENSYYLFSDGYADQFGGESGKKYKYNKLKEFLLSVNNKSMHEQKKLLHAEFENWTYTGTQRFDQVDDVLVVGFRI